MDIKIRLYEKERKLSRTIDIDENELLLMIRCYFLSNGNISANYTYGIEIDKVTI